MGYNNPAFVDDDNKTSNSRSPMRLDEKSTPTATATTNGAATEPCTNDVMHETTVKKIKTQSQFGMVLYTQFITLRS